MNRSIPLPPWARNLLTALLAVLAITGVAVTATLVDDDGDGTPDKVEVVVNKDPGDGQPTQKIEVPEPAVDKARDGLDHQDLEATPVGVDPPTDAELVKGAEVQTDVKPLPEAGAVQGFNGCVTRILPVNFSSRNGARATWQVMHYTVSGNRSGWDDVNAIISLFSNSGRQASSNFVIDAEGHCAYIVPIESKAWTQAGGNPWSISYEIIATGSESNYLGPDGWAKLKSVAHQVARRTAIPLRRGAVSSGCTPVRSGIVQHKDFGLCGGGHVDITPFSIDSVVRELGAPVRALSDLSLKLVRGVRHPAGTGHSRRYWCRRTSAQIGWLARSPDVRQRDRRLAILKRVWRESCA